MDVVGGHQRQPHALRQAAQAAHKQVVTGPAVMLEFDEETVAPETIEQRQRHSVGQVAASGAAKAQQAARVRSL